MSPSCRVYSGGIEPYRRASGRAARAGRAESGRLRAAPAGPAVWWTASARRRGPGARRRSADSPDGRALRRARPGHARARCTASSGGSRHRVRKTVVLVTHDMAEAFALGRGSACSRTASSPRSTCRATIARSRTTRVRPLLEPLYQASAALDGSRVTLFQFWRAHAAEFAALLGQHVLLVGVSTLVAIAAACRIGILARAGPVSARPSSGSPMSSRRFPASRCSGSCCRCRSSADSARASPFRVDSLRAAADRPDHDRGSAVARSRASSRPAPRWG